MNTDGTPFDMNRFFAEYMTVLLGKDIPNPTKNTLKIQNLSHYIGQYHGFDTEFDDEEKTATVKLKNEQLQYCLDGYCEKLWPMGDNKFLVAKFSL